MGKWDWLPERLRKPIVISDSDRAEAKANGQDLALSFHGILQQVGNIFRLADHLGIKPAQLGLKTPSDLAWMHFAIRLTQSAGIPGMQISSKAPARVGRPQGSGRVIPKEGLVEAVERVIAEKKCRVAAACAHLTNPRSPRPSAWKGMNKGSVEARYYEVRAMEGSTAAIDGLAVGSRENAAALDATPRR